MLVLTNDLFGVIFDFCGLSLFVLDYAITACATNAAGATDVAAAAAIAAIADTTADVTIAHVDVTIAVLRWEIITA